MKIMCMGDSITYGMTLADLTQRWSNLVAERTGHTLVNLGISGDTTGGMLARCQTQVFGTDADALLFLGGANDICLTYGWRQAFANIVSVIRQAQSFGVPVLIGIPLPFVTDRFTDTEWFLDRDDEDLAEQCARLAQMLRSFCTAGDIPYVDYRNAFLKEDGTVRNELFTDSVHPNAMGHQAMAEVLCRRFDEIFP